MGLAQHSIPALDQHTMGLRGLCVLAGAAGVGKTSLGLQIGTDIVRRNKDACFVFLSLELNAQEVYPRIMSRLAQVDWRTLLLGMDQFRGKGAEHASYTQEQLGRLEQVRNGIDVLGRRIMILDSGNFSDSSPENLFKEIQRFKESTGTRRAFVLIDSLQTWPLEHLPPVAVSAEDIETLRITRIKKLRDALQGDTVMVTSDARAVAESTASTRKTHELVLENSSRLLHTPDLVMMLSPVREDELLEVLNVDSVRLEMAKEDAAERGRSYANLVIVKGRDGIRRETVPLTFWYNQFRFCEGISEQDSDANTVAAEW